MAKNTPTLDAPGSLITETAALLEADTRTLEVISDASGLPFYWLKSFKGAPNANASASRVQTLYEFLSGKKLKV